MSRAIGVTAESTRPTSSFRPVHNGRTPDVPGGLRGDDPRMRAATRPNPPNRRLVGREATTLGRVGGWCFDHRIGAVGVWLLGLAAVFGAAGAIGPAYEAVLDIPDSDSADG